MFNNTLYAASKSTIEPLTCATNVTERLVVTGGREGPKMQT